MPVFAFILLFSAALFAVEQEQPTPYDLIRPIWPMKWDTSATDDGGTVESFSQYVPNKTKHNPVPAVGSVPQDFVPNGIIPDSLNQAYRDAQNVRIGRIRINQAGYLPEDTEKQFYYVSDGKCSETYSVVDLEGNVVAEGGAFTSTGKTTSSSWTIIAGTNAATNNQKRYSVAEDGPSGTVCVGNLAQMAGLSTDTRYRVKVLNQYSSTFIISDKVYSMVRDATLKFYGINRSGNSESWFHDASHTKDGGGSFVSGDAAVTGFTPQEGALQGGWYDCGDHLKESQTQAYAFMVLAVMAASNPDRDEDNYAYNMGETVNTDGIPDILREAKHGADFFMRSYVFANGVIDNMVVSVGNFGADHGWWGRPENQDALPTTLTGRGGPHERDLRLGELGSNISGQIAAGLAILGKDYQDYDKPFADSCLMVAKKMYDFAKNLKLKEKGLGPGTYDDGKPYVYNTVADGWSSAAYNGNNESHDDLAIAAIALHYATYEDTKVMDYLNDAVEDKTIGVEQEASVGFFNGGWMAWNRDGMRKSSKNTSWANAYTYTLYGFYKMLLKDEATGLKYGIDNTTRLKYAENVALILGTNISYLGGSGSESVTIPTLNGATPVSYGDLWYNMQTDQTWIYNRYQAGNIFEVLAYSDVTKDLEGVKLPQKGVQSWKSAEMKKLGINQLNYMLGVNPWDVSFLLGVGDKNDAHPHHRASNPEGKNMPGANYKYNPPTGALFGGVTPSVSDGNAWAPSTMSWEDYHLSETCIDATAMFVASCAVAVKEEDRTKAPEQVNVEIRYVGYDSAIVKIAQDQRGPTMILYSTSETGPFNQMFKDTVNAVSHEVHMTGLANGTTYYFKVIAINARSEAYTTKWLVDSTSTPFSFTTLVSPPADANIQNIKVCNLSADSAELMWYTPNGQYESKVYWDTLLTSYDQMTCPTSPTGTCDFEANADVSGIPTSFHYVKFGGLKEQTTYYYCVQSNTSIRCTDDEGMPLKFTTPVTSYDFEVRTYQYEFGGLDFLNINIYNNEDRQFDSLTLRLYVTAKPEQIEALAGENNQPGSCPLLLDLDICQAYDEAGFNKPCETDREIRDLLRGALPVKLEDTYNSATGTYDWYIPIPLGSTTIKSSSRMRMDLGFSRGLYQNGKCDPLRTAPEKRMSATSGDWTWAPHKRDIDGADYAGMPVWGKDDGDQDEAPVNPYVVVYRKDEFVVGFSPSYSEMATKRANYEISVAFNEPFNVSNGSYIQIDSTTSTMHLTGNATISENGYVTAIWVNGVALSKDQLSNAAVYNYATGRFDLNIPVKMSIGTNKIDVTIFAGPDPDCAECLENGGCAFVNRTYYVQFSKGDRTAGKIQLLREDGTSVSSPVTDDPMKFKVFVSDKDNAPNESIHVMFHNSRTGDSTEVTLKRKNETLGYFESEWLSAVNSADASLPNVSLLGGDTVTVVYIDVEDPEDSTAQAFFADPTTPIPQKAILTDADCDATADAMTITFSGSQFDGSSIKLDSVRLSLDSTSTTAATEILVTPSEKVIGATANFSLAGLGIPKSAAPAGKATIYMTEDGVVKSSEKTITDGIAPNLTSVAILENENHENVQDTLRIAFSERITMSTSSWPLAIYDSEGAEIDQSTIKVISAKSSDNGKIWEYVVEGNTEGNFIKQGYKAVIKAGFSVVDLATNALSDCNGAVTIIESVRPVPVKYANIIDNEGDGQPDEIYIEFTKLLREKDMLDTIDVYWGKPEVYMAFPMPSSGWALDTVYGEKVAKYITKIDSANGTWIKGSEKKICSSYKDVTTYVTDTTYTIDSTSGDTTGIAKIDTISSTTSQICESYVTTQDSTFVPAIDTIGIDSVQSTITAIRLAITGDTFNKKTYGNRNGNGMILPRQGSLGGFFDDNTATLYDKCPPIILSATISKPTESFYILRVNLSEPMNVNSAATGTNYLQKRRDESLYWFTNTGKLTNTGTTWTFSYADEGSENEVHVGDYIRLPIGTEYSIASDGSSNFPGEENPWILVQGDIEEISFKVHMLAGVTSVPAENDLYAGNLPKRDESFRLSYLVDDKETLIASGKNKLHELIPVTYDTLTYIHGGPTFDIDVEIPLLLQLDSLGEEAWKATFKMSADIYSNTSSLVAQTTYSFTLSDIAKTAMSTDGVIKLRLEWVTHDGIAPFSEAGRHIGTGAYISNFSFKANEVAVGNTANGKYKKGQTKKQSASKTKTFGFRRVKGK